MNRHESVFALSLFVIVMLAASAEANAQAQAPAAAPPNRDEAVLNFLQSTIVDAAYDRVDLEKVLADLRERYTLNIHISWPALEAAGVRRDQRIEVRLKQISLATLLDMVLREAAAGDKGKLSYHVEDGVLIISTRKASREDTVLRAYDIADLIESGYAIRRFANTPVLGLELTGREFVGAEKREHGGAGGGGGMAGGGRGGSLFTGGGEQEERPTAMERVQRVMDLVTESIEPSSWDVAGGDIGEIRAFDSTMLIRHTIRTHQKLAEFLALVRASRPEPLDIDAAIVRMRADKAMEWRREVGAAFPRLSAEHAERLALAAAAEGVLFRGTTGGFNGQAAWFSALTQRDVLTGMMPVVGDQINAFSPVSETSTAGLELIVLPLLSPDSSDLTLDVQMAWTPATQMSRRPVALTPIANEHATIDQTERSMRTVSSATKLALGEAIALSIPSQLADGGGAMEWEDWLIVRVRKPGGR